MIKPRRISIWMISIFLLWIFTKYFYDINNRPKYIYSGISYIFQHTTRAFPEDSKKRRNDDIMDSQIKLDGEFLVEFFQNSSARKYHFSNVVVTQNETKQFFHKEPKDIMTIIPNSKAPALKLTEPNMTNYFLNGKRNDTFRNEQHLPLSNASAFAKLKILFETNFAIIDSTDLTSVTELDAPFVLVIPRTLKRKGSDAKVVESIDQKASLVAASVLTRLESFDVVACLPRRLKSTDTRSFNAGSSNKHLFNSTWCNFLKRNWSIQIRNSGPIKNITIQKYNFVFQFCNIVNGPFVIRTETFRRLEGLSSDYGRLVLLDFFLRSEGQLKIGKTSRCHFSDHLFEIDRGIFEEKGDFPEYSNFGVDHKVLRIITEDKIEWTQCVATDKLCKEVPYLGPPTTLPRIAQPICCSVLLGEILKDAVKVFTKLGIEYRVLFSTLLGGERNGAIIPYARDIDFTLERKYAQDQSSYASLQKYFGKKYHISGYSFIDFPRLIPLFPAHLSITTGPFFKDEYDLNGDEFFSSAVNDSISDIPPILPTSWNTRTYADFYKYDDQYWNGWSTTTIDGENYTTVKHKNESLSEWYGRDWIKPILKHFNGQSDEGQAPDNK